MNSLLELLREQARLEGENEAYERIIKELTALTEPPPPKRSPLDPVVWLERLINAGLDGFERLVGRLVKAIMR